MQNTLDRIIKIIINLSVFLVPLFFLPFSYEAFEFNKQYLIFFLVLAGFFAWLAKMIFIDKELRIKKTFLDIPILAVVSVAILSAIFSSDRFSSLSGTYGRFSDGLILLLSMVILYFLIVNNIVRISNLVKLFIYSGSLVILAGYFSVFGIWEKINSLFRFLPQVMLQKNFNLVSGSMEGLAIFVSIFLTLLVGILLTQKIESLAKKLFYWLVLAASLGLLVIIDFFAAWIILLITLLALVVFSLVTRIFKEDVNRLLLPIILIVIAGVFLFVNLPVSFQNQFPKEVLLSQGQSWSVATKAAVSSPKNVFFGSGLGTFYIDFSKFKSAEINKTNFWQYRLDRPGSGFAETLATTGFLGFLSNLFLIGLFLVTNWLFFRSKDKSLETKNQLPLLMVFVALLVGQVVYYQNITTTFIFWLILALSSVGMQKNFGELKYSFGKFPEMRLIFNAALIVAAIVFLGFYLFVIRFYLADVSYVRALVSQDVVLQQKNLEKAVAFSPKQSQYRMGLAQVYFSRALNESNATTARNFIADSIGQIKIATELSPSSVSAWEVRGLLYQQIIGLAPGAVDWGIQSFEKAIALEPANPILHLELGRLLLATSTERAKKEFEKSLELYPANPGALFELGTINYNNNNLTEALSDFQGAIILSPNYSNAHYALGLIYTSQGKKDLAISEFEKVLELNPGNQDVIDKISALGK